MTSDTERTEAHKEGLRWLRQAEKDVDAAEFLLLGGRYNVSCFLSQQSAEKAIVGYLFHNGAEEVWGNSISDLCEDAAVFDQTFQVLKSSAALLDKYFYITRYPRYLPGGIPSDSFDEIEAKRANHLAVQVLEFIRKRLETI